MVQQSVRVSTLQRNKEKRCFRQRYTFTASVILTNTKATISNTLCLEKLFAPVKQEFIFPAHKQHTYSAASDDMHSTPSALHEIRYLRPTSSTCYGTNTTICALAHCVFRIKRSGWQILRGPHKPRSSLVQNSHPEHGGVLFRCLQATFHPRL